MDFTTTLEDFKILQNGVDTRLEIIQHLPSKFYNITKTAKLVHALKQEDSDAAGIPAASAKRPNDWFSNDVTQELLEECKAQTQLELVHYELRSNAPKQYLGTYVHKLLYDHFLTWLDPKYGMKISAILDRIHRKHNRKLLAEKDSMIDNLSAELEKFRIEALAMRKKAEADYEESQLLQQEMLGELKVSRALMHESIAKHDLTHAQLDKAELNIELTHAKLDKAEVKADAHQSVALALRDVVRSIAAQADILNTGLIQKSIDSTALPANPTPCHGSALTLRVYPDGTHHVSCIGGQRKHVERQIINHVNDRNRVVLTEFTPNANPIDYRNNISVAGQELVRLSAVRENDRRMKEFREKNVIRAKRIATAQGRRAEIVETDEERFQEAFNDWTNARDVYRKLYNRELRQEIAENNDRLRDEIDEFNRDLPRGSPMKRVAATDPAYRRYNDEYIQSTEAYRAMRGYGNTPPTREEFTSGDLLQRNADHIRRNRERMNTMPQLIDERHIPVSFGKSTYQWIANPYLSYEEFIKLFDDVLVKTQASPVTYDREDVDIAELNFDGLDEDDEVKEIIIEEPYTVHDDGYETSYDA